MSKKPQIEENTKNLDAKTNELENLEEVVNKLSQRVKKLVKKNGFSKSLKKKAEMEL